MEILEYNDLEIKVRVIREGDGKLPRKGDEMKIHYTGCFLNKRKFDSSKDRGEPFIFKLGIGQVIQGWDITLMQMSEGERAVIEIPWQLAYGRHGLPPVIPECTDLLFDIEVLKIN